jgi:hypothetical protein
MLELLFLERARPGRSGRVLRRRSAEGDTHHGNGGGETEDHLAEHLPDYRARDPRVQASRLQAAAGDQDYQHDAEGMIVP